MRASAVTVIDALVSVEASIPEQETRVGGQHGSVEHRAIEEPPRQGGIVPRLVPQTSLFGQRVESLCDILRNRLSRIEAQAVPAVRLRAQAVDVVVREMPRQNKTGLRCLARLQTKTATERPDRRRGAERCGGRSRSLRRIRSRIVRRRRCLHVCLIF